MRSKLVSLLALSTSRSAIRSYILLLGNLLDSVFAFLFTLLAFRLLSLADFGIFSALNNFVFTTVMILDFGLGSAMLHFLPSSQKEHPDLPKRYFSASLLARTILAVVFVVPVLFLAPQIAQTFFLTPSSLSVVFSGLAIISISLLDICAISLLGRQKFLISALISTSLSALRLIFLYVLTSLFSISLPLVLLVTFLSAIPGVVIAIHSLKSLLTSKFPKTIYSSIFKFSSWMALSKISSTLSMRLDIQMLLLFLGSTVTGVYSVAGRLANFYPVIIGSLIPVLAAKFSVSSDITSLNRFFPKAVLGLSLLLVGILVGIFISPWLIPLLFGPQSLPAVPIFKALSLAYIPLLLSVIPMSLIVYYYKKPKIAGILGVTQLVIVFIGNLVLIPVFKSLGPAASLGIAHILVLLGSTGYVMKVWKSPS